MKKTILLLLCIMLLPPGLAKSSSLELNPTSYTTIYYKWNGEPGAVGVGGGSFQPAFLDGVQLAYLYCADLFTVIYAGTYDDTQVNNQGLIYGGPLPGAGKVAWLLNTYAGTADLYDEQYALQSAIWRVVEGSSFALDNAVGKTTANQLALFNSYITALGSKTADVSKFAWITPGINDDPTVYQGLVGAPVPIPAAAWLLGTGLIGLVAIRRRK